MHLLNCENPKYIYNKYIKEFVRVGCGKCSTCLNNHSYEWVTRVQLESYAHKYTYMVTLTYDDDHLPAFFFDDDLHHVVLNRDESICIPLNHFYDYIFSYKGTDKESVIESEIDYLRSRLIHPLGLPALYKKDISDFLKRINKYCYDKVTYQFENFRSFCCGEYGGSTYRPHYHLLVWFDDDRICRCFQQILLSCWSFGRSDASAVYSSGGYGYVSQYVNMSSHLPSFYSSKYLRPGHQESKFPPIGSDVVLDSEIREIYDRIPLKRSVYNVQSSKYVLLPLTNAVKDRFFPKLQGYYLLSDTDRVTIYGAVQILCDEKRSFEQFFDCVRSLARAKRILVLIASCFGFQDKCPFGTDVELICNYYFYIEHNSTDYEGLRNSIRRWYFISCRLLYYCSLLDVRLERLVLRISDFYKKLDYECLISMYQKQEAYATESTFTQLSLMYPEFYRLLPFYCDNPDERPFYIDVAMQSFDIFSKEDIPQKEKCPDWLGMKELSNKIFKDTHKRHAANQYLETRLQSHDSDLYNILKSYQSKIY